MFSQNYYLLENFLIHRLSIRAEGFNEGKSIRNGDVLVPKRNNGLGNIIINTNDTGGQRNRKSNKYFAKQTKVSPEIILLYSLNSGKVSKSLKVERK